MNAAGIANTLSGNRAASTTCFLPPNGGGGAPHPTSRELSVSIPIALHADARPATPSVRYAPADHAENDHHDERTVVDPSEWASHFDLPTNFARLMPTCDRAKSSPLSLECVYRGPGPFRLSIPEDGAAERAREPDTTLATLDDILRRYRDQITSLRFDATSLPNPKDAEEMAALVDFPLSWNMESRCTYVDGHPSPIPVLSQLRSLEVHTSRRLSVRSLLQFLQFTPMLQTLAIHNNNLHQSVLPETCSDVPKVNLPHMQQVVLQGLFAGVADDIISRLVMNARTRVSVYVKPAFPSQPLSPLRALCSTIRHACLSYTALNRGDGWGRKDSYRFTFSDVDPRVQVHWDWEVSPGDPASLFQITLDPGAALTQVRTLTVSLNNVQPSFLDWYTVLRPFPSLRHLDLHVTQPGPDPRDPLACGCRTATFRFRGAALLQKVANVPLMFALGLAEHFAGRPEGALPGGTPVIFGSSIGRKLYSATWKCMVRRGAE